LKPRKFDVFAVAGGAGDDVDVEMKYFLLGGGSGVVKELDVVDAEFRPVEVNDATNHLHDMRELVGGNVENVFVMFFRYDQRVVFGDGVDVEKGDRVFVFTHFRRFDFAARDFAENAVHGGEGV